MKLNPLPSDVHTMTIPAEWQLPDAFRRRIGDRIGRQRAMVSDGHLLLLLHAAPLGEEPERIGRLFWRQPDGTWRANSSDAGFEAVNEHFQSYIARLEDLDEREHRATTADEYFHILSELAPVLRAARNQHQALQQARAELCDARDVLNFRDLAYELERQADLLHSDAKNTLEFSIAKRSEEQSRIAEHMATAAHRLNVLVAFFFPIATLCGVFGTNLKHGLEETNWPLPFFAVLASGLLLGVILKSLVTHIPNPNQQKAAFINPPADSARHKS